MPVTTPQVKVDAVRAFGGALVEVVLHGDSYSDAQARADELAAARGLVFVHPFDDPDVIAGQGTVGMEILRQHPGPIDAIFVAVGGGGLIAGVAAYVKALRPEIRVIGVQTERLRRDGPLAGGRAARDARRRRPVLRRHRGAAVGEETFRVCRELVDEMVRVDADAVCAAIKDVFQDTRSILEPAGALAVAGLKAWAAREGCRDATLVAVACGANMNFDRLRFVAERAEVGEAREAVFAVTVPEERGSFLRFCATLDGHGITEFNYRIADGDRAHLFVGVQIGGGGRGADRRRAARGRLPDARPHRRRAGQAAPAPHDRRALLARPGRAAVPLRVPRAPRRAAAFPVAMSPNWNISLFHYRNEGADFGRILVGIQVPPAEMGAFRTFLSTLGYPHRDESDNPAYRLFLTGAA